MWAITREPCDETLVQSDAAQNPCSKSAGRWILVATILASAMAFIDGTVVNVALPALQSTLNATAIDVQWVVEAYSLFLSAFLLIGGSLGDHYGRRRIFLLGVIVFAAASITCGFAATVHQLIAARAFQGVGAALLVPGSLSIISSSFAEKDRGPAIGTWSAFSAITTAVGPVLGGWLIEQFTWRAVFFINVPIAAAIILISLRHVREASAKTKAPLDWLGAFVAAAGLGLLVYGLIESSGVGSGSGSVRAALLVGIVLLILFVLIEARVRNPMVPLQLFRSRVFTGANVLTLLLYGALGGTLFFLPLNLIQVQHYSSAAAGAALLPFILSISLLSRWSGGLVRRLGAKIPLILGPLVAAAGFGLLAIPGAGGSYWSTFFPAITVLGMGMAICIAPLTTTVMGSVEQDRAGTASGVNNAVARTAGLIAIAALGIVMLRVFNRSLESDLAAKSVPAAVSESLRSQRTNLAAAELGPDTDVRTQTVVREIVAESFVTGFRTVMVIGSALAIAAALTGAALIPSKPSAHAKVERDLRAR